MLTRGNYLMISEKKRHGMYVKDIAAELGVHPKTVIRALKRDGVWNAEVIFRRIRAAGYDGGRTILRLYIQPGIAVAAPLPCEDEILLALLPAVRH